MIDSMIVAKLIHKVSYLVTLVFVIEMFTDFLWTWSIWTWQVWFDSYDSRKKYVFKFGISIEQFFSRLQEGPWVCLFHVIFDFMLFVFDHAKWTFPGNLRSSISDGSKWWVALIPTFHYKVSWIGYFGGFIDFLHCRTGKHSTRSSTVCRIIIKIVLLFADGVMISLILASWHIIGSYHFSACPFIHQACRMKIVIVFGGIFKENGRNCLAIRYWSYVWGSKFRIIQPFLNHFKVVEIHIMTFEIGFIYKRIIIMHQNEFLLVMQAVLVDIFITSKCFECEISIWIDEIANDKIIEFVHFFLQFRSSLSMRSKYSVLCLALWMKRTSHSIALYL